MLTGILNEIRHERAAKSREIEYIREDASSFAEDERLLQIDDRMLDPDDKEYEDLAEVIDQIELSDEEEEAELERIMNADHDLTFDEMAGI